MRPPRPDTRTKLQLDTNERFYDSDYGWVRRLPQPCPKCKRPGTMARLEDQGVEGCTHCSYAHVLEGYAFKPGGYYEARKLLETLFDERRVEKPVQYRFQPMNMKRN